MNERTVRIGPDGLLLDAPAGGGVGTPMPLWSGAMHYWRVRREAWGRCLANVRALGFAIVESYVPWGVHEAARGRWDWTGARDLRAFLDEAQRRDLKVILRPGPHVNAELPYFGFPERIVSDPAIQARTAQDTPAWLLLPPRAFPVPSYASRRFYAEVEGWFDAFAAQVEGALHPGGPVVALQVDNEMSFFFRTGAFDLDYAPDAVADYREHLRARWGGDEAALRDAYDDPSASFGRAEPPRRYDVVDRGELRRHLDWADYRAAYLRNALARLAGMLRGRGLGTVPLFHNYPPSETHPPMDLPGAENVLDLAGVDLYHKRGELRAVKRRALTLAGSSRLPYVPELQSGGWPWWVPLLAPDRDTTALGALMHGVRAANFYMVVERDRWFGAPVSADGVLREADAAWFRRLNAALARVGFFSLRRHAKVALVCPRLYRQMADLSDVLAPLSPMVFAPFLHERARCRDATFGFRHAPQIVGPELFDAFASGLDGAAVPYEIVDGGVASLARWDVVLCPTLEPIEAALWRRLLARAQEGALVVIGPDVPRFDERLLPLDEPLRGGEARAVGFGTAAAFSTGAGEVWVLAPESTDLPAAAAAVCGALAAERPAVLPPVRCTTPPVESACFVDGGARVAAIFVANPTSAPRAARLVWDEAPAAAASGAGADAPELEDALGGEAVSSTDVRLDPYQVRMLVGRRGQGAGGAAERP
jgi:beta-galactosidase